jgi:nucleoside phosphorylase
VILFLAAFEPELAALDSKLPRAIVGVGLVEAALGTARALAAHRAHRVILVGTVGAYPRSHLSIGDVVVASRVLLASPSGALVPGMPQSVVAASDGFDATPSVVATTLAITTDDDVAAAMGDSVQADVEHLEAFAVGRACELAGVMFSAVLGVANIVGARGREQWGENHVRVSALACAAAVRSRPTMPSPA